jgi:hypothetical protein
MGATAGWGYVILGSGPSLCKRQLTLQTSVTDAEDVP